MATAKLLLLLAMLPAQHYSTTPPNARPPSGELRKQVGWELVIPRVPMLLRALLWSWAILECVGLFAVTDYCPPGLSQSIVHHLVRSDDPQRTLTHISSLTPTFLVGSVLSIFGSLLRIHCYDILGSMFTFDLSIRKEHKLITSGAYAIVRHPSYTGGLFSGVGLMLCILSPNLLVIAFSSLFSSLFPDPDLRTKVMVVSGCTYLLVSVGLVVGLVQRMGIEDAMLEKNFGEAWRAWARRVPDRLVPWVY
ncbi:hypothetical protein PAXRUDRAFT_827493 [Paxillus rubicundulus Ve08.2h10]|uniref:Protein-S-isoprenylcysteine O-methyltransferase n=1 Tax=Paxillus rubicundulus Ve08.2h10 TaxID=930991 RepID=A0A0D0E2R3_9AGAM|nr:hypothetical protein PAXRUDRAFT_827493 [Paxillus rubicundulus Ve08.2h10]